MTDARRFESNRLPLKPRLTVTLLLMALASGCTDRIAKPVSDPGPSPAPLAADSGDLDFIRDNVVYLVRTFPVAAVISIVGWIEASPALVEAARDAGR